VDESIALLAIVGIVAWLVYQAMQSGDQSSGVSMPSTTPPAPPPSPGKLSVADLAQLAANAGFSGNDLLIAVAIALAESGGDPSALGDKTIGGSVGLWQIYVPKHPEFTGWNLYDPQTNANAAFRVYQAAHNTFTPWATYGNGMYMSYLDLASSYLSA
jgi:hypothetical protein